MRTLLGTPLPTLPNIPFSQLSVCCSFSLFWSIHYVDLKIQCLFPYPHSPSLSLFLLLLLFASSSLFLMSLSFPSHHLHRKPNPPSFPATSCRSHSLINSHSKVQQPTEYISTFLFYYHLSLSFSKEKKKKFSPNSTLLTSPVSVFVIVISIHILGHYIGH